MKTTLKKIQKSALEFRGCDGPELKDKVMTVIRRFTREYAKVTGLKPLEILGAVEKRRNYCVVNYYQDANFPKLDESVSVFQNRGEFFEKFPSKKFICPFCKEESTDPNACNSGAMVERINGKKKTKEKCNWKSYGLFGALGKGFSFIVAEGFLDNPTVYEIFPPAETFSQIALREPNQSKNSA